MPFSVLSFLFLLHDLEVTMGWIEQVPFSLEVPKILKQVAGRYFADL